MVDEPILNPAKVPPEADNPEGRGASTPPDLTPSKADVPASVEDKPGTQNGHANIREWWKVIVETLTLLAVIWYACVASKQLTQMREATVATQKSAEAALQSAEAIRPRLVVTGLTPQPLSGNGPPLNQGKLHVWFQVPNYGPLVAGNLQIQEFDNVSTPDRVTRLSYGQPRQGYGSVVPPAQAINGQFPGWGMDGKERVAEEDVTGLKEHRLVATFSILVKYDDAAGKTHHAESCIVFTFPPNAGSNPCPWETTND